MVWLDRLKLGWEVMTQLEPEFAARRSADQGTLLRQKPTSVSAPNSAFQGILESAESLPPCSIMIGTCEDKSPLFLDLMDPVPGSILITGDEESGMTRLLRSILLSASIINPPRRVRYAIITSEPKELENVATRPHLYKVISSEAKEAIDLIMDLVDLAELRRAGKQLGSAIILAIDDLAHFLNGIDHEAVEQLTWLIQAGPESQVWTIATLNTDDVQSIDAAILECFGTRLLGKIKDDQITEELSGTKVAKAGDLTPGKQFGVMFGEDWVRFTVPQA